jgi:hypothetical protein
MKQSIDRGNLDAGVTRKGSTASHLRGPPRKPKQSGFALWIGNLPPLTDIFELKEYFSTDLKDEIQSVFWIKQTQCAFVNYLTREGSSRAMVKFHESIFRGLRILCRPRESPQGPAVSGQVPGISMLNMENASIGNISEQSSVPSSKYMTPTSGEIEQTEVLPNKDNPPLYSPSAKKCQDSIIVTGDNIAELSTSEHLVKDRYFVVKSLTIEDLEFSVQNGLWATQPKNDKTFQDAFEVRHAQSLSKSTSRSRTVFQLGKEHDN